MFWKRSFFFIFFISTQFVTADVDRARVRSICPTKEPRPLNENYVAWCIGMDYIGTEYELQNCINDVFHMVRKVYHKVLGIPKRNMTIMTDWEKGTDLEPTWENIWKFVPKFVEQLNFTKRGVMHYSGHGTWVRDRNKDEKDSRDECLVPLDSHNLIVDDDLWEYFIKQLDPDVQLTITADCCHSGTVFDLPLLWDLDGFYEEANALKADDYTYLAKVITISGCDDPQTSSDGGYIKGNKRGAGAMTGAYIQTLRDHNFDLTYRELLVGMYNYLEKLGTPQRPRLSTTFLINLDDKFMSHTVQLRPSEEPQLLHLSAA